MLVIGVTAVLTLTAHELLAAPAKIIAYQARLTFLTLFGRLPAKNDQPKVLALAYGTTGFKRDLGKERQAITLFTKRFQHLPKTAAAWRAVQVLAYGPR